MSPTLQDLSNDTTFSKIKSRVPVPLTLPTNFTFIISWHDFSYNLLQFYYLKSFCLYFKKFHYCTSKIIIVFGNIRSYYIFLTFWNFNFLDLMKSMENFTITQFWFWIRVLGWVKSVEMLSYTDPCLRGKFPCIHRKFPCNYKTM